MARNQPDRTRKTNSGSSRHCGGVRASPGSSREPDAGRRKSSPRMRILSKKELLHPEHGNKLGELRRPWQKYVQPRLPSTLMVMAKRNYKCYADFGLGLHFLVKKLTVLDTGAGPNFVRKDELPPKYTQKLRPAPLLKICDANGNLIGTCGVIDLMKRIGTRLVRVDFVVWERLAAGVVLGCELMDRLVEAIYPRRKTIKLDDGSSVPITRRPLRATTELTAPTGVSTIRQDRGTVLPTGSHGASHSP